MMQFTLLGFTESIGFRVFAFEGVNADRTRTSFTVRADLALTRRYSIRLQELPLLCRGLLERQAEGQELSADLRRLTFTEAEMSMYASDCARTEALRKKSPRRAPTAQVAVATAAAPSE
jgi:hypothetical protein